MIDDLDIMERLSPSRVRCRDGVTVVPTDTDDAFEWREELARIREERRIRACDDWRTVDEEIERAEVAATANG